MRLVFGECEFDSGERMVFRHGRGVPVSLKAFQLLELLVDRRPEAVAKAEILAHLWPDTFVSDASLHNLVAEIRAALGDSRRAPRYIRTVPRFGYAFCADARRAPAHTGSSPSSSSRRLVAPHEEWALSEGSNLVGRDRECAVRIDSPTLSRQHARIVVTSQETTIEDLGSKNGTRVNGEPVTHAVRLNENDEVQLGSVTVTYRVQDLLPSTMTRR